MPQAYSRPSMKGSMTTSSSFSKERAHGLPVLLLRVGEMHADAGAAGAGLHDERKGDLQLLQGDVFVFSCNVRPVGCGYARGVKELLRDALIHREGAAQGVGPCIADPQGVERSLETAVLADAPCRPMKVMSASAHSSITLGPSWLRESPGRDATAPAGPAPLPGCRWRSQGRRPGG